MGTRDVLAELEEIGAVGDREISPREVRSVEIEEGAPSAALVDARGPRMVELCDQAIRLHGLQIKAHEALQDVFEQMKQVWTSEPPAKVPEAVQAPQRPLAVVPPVEEDAVEVVVDEEEVEPASHPVQEAASAHAPVRRGTTDDVVIEIPLPEGVVFRRDVEAAEEEAAEKERGR